MNFGRCEGAWEYSGDRALPLAPVSTPGELEGHGLGPTPAFCARVWPEGAHCLVVQPVSGHETETLSAVSRQRPLGLSLGWGYPGMDALSHQNGNVEKANILGCLPLTCPSHLTLKVRRLPTKQPGWGKSG